LFLAGVCVFLIGWHSLTRTLHLTPDSFIYIDTAQSLLRGNGLSHGVLQLHDPDMLEVDDFHAPNTTYAPLYPLTIAALAGLGIHIVHAALLVAALGYGLTLIATYLLARRLYGAPTALLTTAILLHFLPLTTVGICAWSESLGLACLAFGFLTLTRIGTNGNSHRFLLLSGVCLALAFAARYALLPACIFGVIVVAHQTHGLRRRTHALAAYALGVLLVALPILARNYVACGHMLGPPRPPSTRGLLDNLRDLYAAALESGLPAEWIAPDPQSRLIAALLVLILGVLVLRRRGRDAANTVFAGNRWILPIWAVVYTGFLVVYRTLVTFDQIGPRLAVPGLVFVIPPLVAVAIVAIPGQPRLIETVTALLVALAVFRAGYDLATTPQDSPAARVARSERLTWIARNTTDRDVIIGDSLMDLPAYRGPRRCLSFFPLEGAEYQLTRENLADFLKPRIGRVDRAYIVLRRVTYTEPSYEPQWRRYCGDFITDLVYGRADRYPGIRPLANLKDGFVFEVDTTHISNMLE